MNKNIVYNPKLLRALEIECNYQKHKDRLLKINCSKTKTRTAKRDEVLEGINNYKKNRIISDIFKAKDKHEKLVKENSIIHTNLKKLYRQRPASSTSNMSKAMSEKQLIMPPKNKLLKKQQQRLIQQQNIRLRKKLLSAKSNFSRSGANSIRQTSVTLQRQKININPFFRRNQMVSRLMSKRDNYKLPSRILKAPSKSLVLPKIKKRLNTSLC